MTADACFFYQLLKVVRVGSVEIDRANGWNFLKTVIK